MTSAAPERPFPEALARTENLPSLPAVAMEVLRLCRAEDTTLDDLAEAIAKDPALSAKLLRYANSPLFGTGQEVTTLQRAALVLGMKSVQLMALSFSLAESLPRDGGGDFDYDGCWRRSLACAVAARALCRLSGNMVEDEAFLAGLLAYIGQLVMAQCLDGYREVLEHSGDAWPRPPLERELLGFDRSDVGLALLSSWHLPPLICLGVGYMNRPEELPDDAPEHARPLVEVMSLALLTVEVLCDASGTALAALESEGAARLGVDSEHVTDLLIALEGPFREASELLDMPLPTGRSHAQILADAREEMLKVGMQTAGELLSARTGFAHRSAIPNEAKNIDTQTGLVNQAGFATYVMEEVRARITVGVPRALGVLMIEAVCATAPPAKRIMGVAWALTRTTRVDDLPTHLADERFAVAVPECTPFGLRTLAERIRRAVEHTGHQVHVGGACLGSASHHTDGDALVRIATRYLEKARAQGESCCEVRASVVHPKS